jgi:2-keto-4-pentenoate hydratase
MEQHHISEAARLIARARRTGELLPRLPEPCRPRDASEAYAIELALIDELGETLAGWKVALAPDHGLMAGLLVASRIYRAGATIDVSRYSLRGAEIEIGFRLDRAFPPRAADYTREEIESGVTAFVGVEIVDTRFASYEDTAPLDRMADFLANGAYVVGPARADWREHDLSRLEAYVSFDGRDQVRRVGGHPARDPLLPAIALINRLRETTGAEAGAIVTTGSYTGMTPAPRNCKIEAGFANFGSLSCRLD